jgi:hypothetical protein
MWEVLCELFPALFDRGDESLGDTAISRMSDQSVHSFLPSALGYLGGDRGAGNNARIVFRQRDENEDS